jgi:hypothetical protein
VQIYTDWVPDEFYSPEDRARFQGTRDRQEEDAKEVNRRFEQKVFGTTELPLYVILEPQPDGTILAVNVFQGLIRNGETFANFLRSAPKPDPGAVRTAGR